MPSKSTHEEVPNADRLLQLIGDTEGLVEIPEFHRELLDALRRAVPCDWVSLNDIGPPATIAVIIDPPMNAEQHQIFARYAHQNPLVRTIAETRDGRAFRISDVITQAEFHALEIYTEFYKTIGMEYQIAFTLPHEQHRILGVALSRNGNANDFTDAERDLLNQARPFLIQAYRNAIRYSELLAGRDVRQTTARTPRLESLIALGLTGRQAEVLQLLAIGTAEREIAAILKISYRTVQKHLQHCYRQLGVTNRSQAGAIAWSTIDATSPRRPAQGEH